ncbi:hypothetical protein AX15_001979 [Amanita polypyramis BW_CC]|nr:hypothetical protein AX15_001979 [Amanita polypyramis BW_CC]
MSSAPARCLFLVLLSLSCILWSQSQQFEASRHVLGHPSLIKRISAELLTPAFVNNTTDGPNLQCRPLAYPIASQCSHVELACNPSTTFLSVNYLQHYFCTLPSLRPLIFAALIVWLVFLFSTLGISASEFFTPNLATVAQIFGLDENVAGVTFLAFGNGSPDLSSTFSAMRAGSGSLAIGELLGAASFIVSCVVGSMCIIKPFHVYRWPFLRDVGFFTTAVGLLLYILSDGKIQLWEASLMIALYVFYTLVVGLGSWWSGRQEQKKLLERMIRAEYDEGESNIFGIPYRDQLETSRSPELSPLRFASPTPTRSRATSSPQAPRLRTTVPPRGAISRTPSPSPSTHVNQLPSLSLLGALEFREVVSSLRDQSSTASLDMFDSPVTPYAGGHYYRSRGVRSPSTTISPEVDPWDAALGPPSVPLDDRSPELRGPLIFSPAVAESESRSQQGGYFDEPAEQSAGVPAIHCIPPSPIPSSDSPTYIASSKRENFMRRAGHVIYALFPTLHHFRKQSVLFQMAFIFASPAVLALTITLPVVVTPFEGGLLSKEKIYSDDAPLVGFEEEGVQRVLIAEEEMQQEMHEIKFNKWLMALQCALAPPFCVGVLFNGAEQQKWLLLAAGIGGLAIAILVAVFAKGGDRKTGKLARCSMGFFVSVVWIMAIADEVVNVLQTFGFIFGLSDAIIGLTIFAVGNSLADLVANMTVAAFAPIMGFSACFGSPMLNILLGIGISGTYITSQTGEPYDINLSKSLYVSTIGLLCLLGATLVFVPLNGYYLTRKWGILLILSYVSIMVVNVAVELRS